MRWTEYELVETGVKVREKDLAGIRETTVDYDRIGREATYFLSHSAIAKLGMILFLIISIVTGAIYALHGDAEKLAWIFWLGATAFTFVYYENTKREGFRLASDYGAVVLSGKKKDVEAFVVDLTKKKEEFIEKSVERRLAIMERAEVEKYLWALREGSVLTQLQYESVRAKAGLRDEYRPQMGFGA
jgi:hypothetical protein